MKLKEIKNKAELEIRLRPLKKALDWKMKEIKNGYIDVIRAYEYRVYPFIYKKISECKNIEDVENLDLKKLLLQKFEDDEEIKAFTGIKDGGDLNKFVKHLENYTLEAHYNILKEKDIY